MGKEPHFWLLHNFRIAALSADSRGQMSPEEKYILLMEAAYTATDEYLLQIDAKG